MKFDIGVFFLKSVETIHVSLKYDRKKATLLDDQYTFLVKAQ